MITYIKRLFNVQHISFLVLTSFCKEGRERWGGGGGGGRDKKFKFTSLHLQ